MYFVKPRTIVGALGAYEAIRIAIDSTRFGDLVAYQVTAGTIVLNVGALGVCLYSLWESRL